jgi:tetratricopeptide (TPR) repeat protein
MFGFGYSKEKCRASAEKYLQANKLQNAITEYEKILKAEPKDLAILNTVGDIHARLGQNDKAIERFRVVADTYIADGSNVKAIALYKKMTKLDPTDLATMEKLAELYRRQGLVADARSQLLHTAEAYTRRNQSKETLRILKQLVQFDPENVQILLRTTDLMIRGGQKREAKEMLSKSASTLVERRALEPASKILERLIQLDASNMRAQEMYAHVVFELGDAAKATELFEAIPDLDSRVEGLRTLLAAWIALGNFENANLVARKLAGVHRDVSGMGRLAAALYKQEDTLGAIAIYEEFASELITQDKEGVLACLHGAVSRVRSNPDALQTLYGLFQRVNEASMFAEILELLGHACVQSGQLERARDVYKQLIELEPENASHMQSYSQVCARLDPSAPPPPMPTRPREEEAQTLEQFRTDQAPALPAQQYSPQVEETIAAALSEAELYESYSSKSRSIGILENALTSAPEDLRLLRTLGVLYRQEGDESKAARCHATMQRVLEGLGATEAAAYYANLAGPAEETTWEAKGSEFAVADFDLTEEKPSGGTEEIDLSGEWESAWSDDSDAESAAASAPESASEAAAQPEDAAKPGGRITELLEEARFCLSQQIWNEAEAAIARLAEIFPEHPELPELRARLQAAQSAPAPEAEVSEEAANGPSDSAQSSEAEDNADAIEVIEVSGEEQAAAAPDADAEDAAAAVAEPEAEAVQAFAPAEEPSLDNLAAELDEALGDEFTPVAQPRRSPPPATAKTDETADENKNAFGALDAPEAAPPGEAPDPIPVAAAPAAAPSAEPVLELEEATPHSHRRRSRGRTRRLGGVVRDGGGTARSAAQRLRRPSGGIRERTGPGARRPGRSRDAFQPRPRLPRHGAARRSHRRAAEGLPRGQAESGSGAGPAGLHLAGHLLRGKIHPRSLLQVVPARPGYGARRGFPHRRQLRAGQRL